MSSRFLARSTNADEQSYAERRRERVTAESAVDKSRKTGPRMAQSAGLHCGLPKCPTPHLSGMHGQQQGTTVGDHRQEASCIVAQNFGGRRYPPSRRRLLEGNVSR